MLKRSVALMAKRLDRKKPGWAKKVDTQKLNMFDNENCILGQVFGFFSIGFSKLMLNPKREKITAFIDPTSEKFWIAEIQKRLKKKK